MSRPRSTVVRARGPGRVAAFCLLALLGTVVGPIPPGAGASGDANPGPGADRAEACDTPLHGQFDFWIGAWRVTDGEGEQAGRNTIRRVAGGCGLLERWTGADGETGTSLNFVDPSTGRWTQVWVGSKGMILRLQGRLRDGRMVLEGKRSRAEEPMRDRIAWEARDDGSVVQTWSVSRDGGESWSVSWEGVYRPVGR